MSRGAEPGYRRQPKIYRLVFDEHPGLVVRTKSASAAMVFEITQLQDTNPTVEVVREMFDSFSTVLVDWNLESEEGVPIPATSEAMMEEDFDFILLIINAWVSAVTGVSAPLEQPSNSGLPSLVESLPMDVLSENQAS